MVGYLAWAEPKRGQRSIRLEERHILRMRFLQAEIVKSPHGAILSRRGLGAGERLRERGVTEGGSYSQLTRPAILRGDVLVGCGGWLVQMR